MKENREQNVVEMQNHPFSGDELITDPVKILHIIFFPTQNDMLFAVLVFFNAGFLDHMESWNLRLRAVRMRFNQ